jgi:hypothetical protein
VPIRPIAIVTAAFAITSCALQENKLPIATMSWDDARAAILQGRVKEIFQTQGYIVVMTMKNGGYERAESPQLDEVFEVLKTCGPPCAGVKTSMD